jgi:DNA-binding NtrC family response regulator
MEPVPQNPPPAKKRILVIDDELPVRDTLARYISIQGHEPLFAATAAEAIQRTRETMPDLILLDVSMPGEMDGLVILRLLHEKFEQTKVIMMAAGPDIPKANVALNCGASDYIAKPIDLPALKRLFQIHFQS